MNDMTGGGLAPDRPWEKYYDDKRFDPNALISASVPDMIREACAEHRSKPAFSCVLPNGATATLTFDDLDRHSDSLAFFLRHELGLDAGDAVAIQAPNCLAYPVVAYGVFKAGLVLTGVNPLYTVREAQFQIADCQAKALFCIDLFGDKLADNLEGSQVEHVISLSVVDFFPALKAGMMKALLKASKKVPKPTRPVVKLSQAVKRGARHRHRAGGDVGQLYAGRSLDDTAFYQYSGGTTGRSKGAQISQRNILSNMTQQDVLNGNKMKRGEELGILVLPLYHIYALALSGMAGMRVGTHTVLVPNPRPLSNLKPVFEKFSPTMLPGINTLYQGLLNEPWFVANPPKSLRWCFSGAAPLQQSTAKKWKELTGCTIHEGYGLTEGTCVVTSSPLDDRYKPGTVGVPIPGTELRFVDEDGNDMPPGEPGHILVRGPQVMKGYLNRQEATDEAIRDGWLHTGDVGLMDEDGFVRIVDRKKDMIIVSGFNVFPAELEDVLAHMPGVGEVAVVGVPDDETGERIRAFIVRSDETITEDDVKTYCAKTMTNYKRPKDVVFIDEIPKSPVGKVLRRELRDRETA